MSPIEEYLKNHAEAMRYVKLSAGALAFESSFTPLPHGDLAFDELIKALKAARHEIFLATWFLEPDMELLRSDWDQPRVKRAANALDSILLGRARDGVVVRGLVWNFLNLRFAPPTGSGGSAGGTTTPLNPIMRRVRKLAKDLAAISKQNQLVVVEHPMPFATRTVLGVSFPIGGSHHQKIWITRSDDKHTAFVGGINLRQHDWDSAAHDVLDQRRNAQDMEGSERKRKAAAKEDPNSPPRHDWMTKLEGPAAHRALQEFHRRWGMAGKGKFPIVPFNKVPAAGKILVQTSHTYPLSFGGGDFEILKAYQHAIARAQRYAYFENQYWTSESLTDALAARLKQHPKLQVVIVLPDKAEDAAGPLISGEQWHQLSRLWAVAGTNRVRAYALYKKHPAKTGYVNIYIHAKFAIIDDLWATIGSANTNNRSMILDTEYNAQVAHRSAVTALRKQAWRELLEDPRAEDNDPVSAIKKGFHPLGEANKRRMEKDEELEGLIAPLTKPKRIRRLPESLRPLL